MFFRTTLVTSLLSLAGFAQSAPTDVPASLKPPAGQQMVLQAHAMGVQIYTCNADASGKFAWTLKAPQAELRDADGHMIITHSAGPKWQHKDGSLITGSVVKKENAPDGTSIPWLLVAADNSHSAEGVLSKVEFVQRIHTEGGQPPASGCDASSKGDEVKSKYSADYVFYAPSH